MKYYSSVCEWRERQSTKNTNYALSNKLGFLKQIIVLFNSQIATCSKKAV